MLSKLNLNVDSFYINYTQHISGYTVKCSQSICLAYRAVMLNMFSYHNQNIHLRATYIFKGNIASYQ